MPDLTTSPESDDLQPSALEALGIDVGSELVYRAVLRRPGETIASLSLLIGRSAADLAADLAPLVDHSLVKIVDDTILPEPPGFALRNIVTREFRRVSDAAAALEHVESQLHRYVSEHQRARRRDWTPMPLDVITEPQIVDVMEALIDSTGGEMLFMRPDQWHTSAGPTMDRMVVRALEAGRTSRTLYPLSVLHDHHASVVQRGVAGEQIRLLVEVPSRMAVFGDEAVVLPDHWGTPGDAALLFREGSVIAACRALFEQLWSGATTVSGYGAGSDGAGSGSSARRGLSKTGGSQLLDLMAHGAKDEQIARTLGLSLRTVRRRVAELLVELGVDTRFQAGVEAARRGWL